MRYSHNNNAKFWRWDNWQCYFAVIVFLLVFFPLWRYIQSQIQKNKEKTLTIEQQQQLFDNQDPIKQQSSADAITTSKSVQSRAKQLSALLGTLYSDAGNWWDFLNPRGWTEDDKQIADIVIFERNNYALIAKLYNKCYSNSRNLSNDLIKLLDANELLRVQKYVNI